MLNAAQCMHAKDWHTMSNVSWEPDVVCVLLGTSSKEPHPTQHKREMFEMCGKLTSIWNPPKHKVHFHIVMWNNKFKYFFCRPFNSLCSKLVFYTHSHSKEYASWFFLCFFPRSLLNSRRSVRAWSLRPPTRTTRCCIFELLLGIIWNSRATLHTRIVHTADKYESRICKVKKNTAKCWIAARRRITQRTAPLLSMNSRQSDCR